MQLIKIYKQMRHTWLHAAARCRSGAGRGDTPRPGSGGAAVRRDPTSKVRRGGREEIPHIQGQEGRPRGDTPRPGSGGAAVRREPMAKVRRGGCEEIPHVQGQERSRRE